MSIGELKKSAVQPEKDVTLYLSDISRGVRKFWWLSVLLAVLCGGISLYWNHTHFVPQYQTTATFTVLTQNETVSGLGDSSAYSFSYNRATAERLAAAFQYAARSSIFQKKACEELGVSAMPATLSVTFTEGTNLMTVSASGRDPQQVYAVLLAFVQHYSDVTMYIIGPSKLVTISAPALPTAPYNAHEPQTAALKAVLFGLALGIAWIALYAVLRQTVRTKADIRQELNQTCIGVLPQVTFKRRKHGRDTRVLLTNPAVSGDFLESLRLLRDAVQNGLQSGEKVALITSTAPEEGKSVVTLNLAAILAKNDKKVLVLDADLRNSGIAAMLRTDGAERAPEHTTQSAAPSYRIQHCTPLGVDVLHFSARVHSPGKILQTEPLRKIVEALKSQYDLILIDTPPCGMISDTAVIAGAADAALYVVRQDTVLTSRIRNGINTLLSTDIRVLGCILNGATTGIGSYGYYYSYKGYRSYSGAHSAEKGRGK